MAEPFPRASPGVPPVAMALRLGAGPAKAAPTLRSARSIFPAAHVAGKNDSDSFRLAPETRKGVPLPGPFPGDGGRESLVSCLLLLEAPAIHLAAKRLRRRRGRCGGRTGGPGRLPASVGNTCCLPGREAASAAGGPLQRQDEGPRSAACFYRSTCDPPGRGAASTADGPLRRQDEGPRSSAYFCWKCLLSAWPRSGFGGKRAAAAAGRRSPGRLPASVESTCCPARRLAALQAGVFSAVSLRLPCGKGAGARRATEGLSAETSPERIIPGQYFSA